MPGFIPDGFAPADEYAAAHGLDRTGALLASGKLEAYRLNAYGQMFLVPNEIWAGRRACEILQLGKFGGSFAGKWSPTRGDRVLIKVPIGSPSLMGKPGAANAPTRQRGPRPAKRQAVKDAMLAHGDMNDLAAMTEETMSALFDASRDVCRRARIEVLSELEPSQTATERSPSTNSDTR